MQITIHAFAALKDYFQKEFVLEAEPDSSIQQLKDKLIVLNPMSEKILNRCRFAVNDQFVSPEYNLVYEQTVCIIPPSSGG